MVLTNKPKLNIITICSFDGNRQPKKIQEVLMGLRLRFTVVGKQHMTRTFLKCGTFGPNDLRHVMTNDELKKIFVDGTGVDIDFFTEKGTVHLCAEGSGTIHFGSEVMLPGKKYPMKLNDENILKIGDALFHAKVFESDFDRKYHP